MAGAPNMGARFEELDRRPTPMGEIGLRRRRDPVLDVDVYEARLDEEFLMSSLFTEAEVALARLGLAAAQGQELDVVVGGLGLGFTARAALEDDRVRSLRVVEALGEVIGWHRDGRVPLAAALVSDPRCELVEGDFFSRFAAGVGGEAPLRAHAVLLDIDHSPRRHLDRAHASFYEAAGLRSLAGHLHPGGVFALWSDDAPDAGFTDALSEVFAAVEDHVITFDNPYTGGMAANTVYVATLAG